MRNFKKIIALIVAVITVMSCAVPMVQAADPKLNHRKDFDWGVVMHTPNMSGKAYNTAYLEEHLHLAAEMGSKLIRIDTNTGALAYTDKLVRLANAYGMKVMIIIYIPGKTLTGEYDYDAIEQHFRTFASRYDGKKGYGKADYIQIDNEMDVTLMNSSSKGVSGGQNISDYDEPHLRTLTGQVKAALKGVKNSGTSAKTIINFGWTHWGMFDYFVKEGVQWDIIGYDWYSDMFQPDKNPNNYFWAGDIVYEKYKKKIVICETNMNGHVIGSNPSSAEVNKWHSNASNWDPLVKCMEHYYNKDYVIGCTFYEFCDELEREGEKYEPEARYGLLFTDKNTGAVIEPKPIYYRIQKMIGGGTVKKLDWSKVLATYKDDDDEEEDEIGQNNNSQSGNVNVITNQIHIGGNSGNSQNSGTTNQTGSGDTITEIFREEDATGTGESNKIFTLPIIICLVAGGLIVLLAIGLGVFFILRKPKAVSKEIPEAEATNENE